MRISRALRSVVVALLLALCSFSIHADYEAGVLAAERGDYATALREFTEAAEAGLDLAQYNLGVMYYSGRGVEQNYKQAFNWTRKAAEQGHRAAQFNLATLYYNGLGMWWRSHRKALQWYTEAAQQGHAEAQYNLAMMYRDGEGARRDNVRAHFWANVSRENEFAAAEEMLAEISAMMQPAQREQAQREFVEWLLAR